MTHTQSIDELSAENHLLREKFRLLEREKEAWRKTQFIANAADQLLTMIDRKYVYESVNQAYCRARGQKPEDVVGKKVADVWGRSQFESIIKPKLDNCFKGNVTSTEDWFKFNGRELRCYQVTYNPYHDASGRVTHAVVVTHDITARKHAEEGMKRANDRLERRVQLRTEALVAANDRLRTEIEERKRIEKALRASEERYRTLYHHTPAMLHSIDREARLVSVSDYWSEVMGYSKNEVIGKPLVEFLTPESREYAEQVVLPQFFKTGFCKDIPYRFIKKNGDVVDIGALHCCHLPALHVRHPAVGVEDEYVDIAAAFAALDGGRAGITGGRTHDHHFLVLAFQHIVEEAAQQLQGEVLEGQGGTVEQLQHPLVGGDLDGRKAGHRHARVRPEMVGREETYLAGSARNGNSDWTVHRKYLW